MLLFTDLESVKYGLRFELSNHLSRSPASKREPITGNHQDRAGKTCRSKSFMQAKTYMPQQSGNHQQKSGRQAPNVSDQGMQPRPMGIHP